MQEILVMKSAYASPSARTDCRGGGERDCSGNFPWREIAWYPILLSGVRNGSSAFRLGQIYILAQSRRGRKLRSIINLTVIASRNPWVPVSSKSVCFLRQARSCTHKWFTVSHLHFSRRCISLLSVIIVSGPFGASGEKISQVTSLCEFDLPKHVFPSPENPRMHVHMNDSLVLVQTALTSQLWEMVEHSSISTEKGRGNDHICQTN